MPITLLIIGIILIDVAVRGTQDDFFRLVKGDFTGRQNFLVWLVALLAVAAIGYIPKLKPVSNWLLVLLVTVILLSNRGFFAEFQRQISATSNTQKETL